MITLSMQCSRCNKEVSHDMTNQTLSNDLVRKFGFTYAHNGKTNVVICVDCGKEFSELQERLEATTRKELCGFFENCGEDKDNGDIRGTKDG